MLPGSGRLFLIVRGPAPSCRVAGVIPVRAKKGANTVFFAGRVQGRRLEPGVYQLSLSRSRRPVLGAPVTAVRVVSARRSVPVAGPARVQSCTTVATTTGDGVEQQPRARAAVAAVPAAPLRPPLDRAGVSGGDEVASPVPPTSIASGEGRFEPLVGIAVLALVGALLLAMLALVTRFLRGSWNP